ncbi:MAG: carbamoyltransferase HypF [Proteobacteria bacterium]|nr:carbamoyltransferase HypF [Pseudomonadota bacterium]MBU1708699.1 carbamoyltransferase HypF [Pseudomonadota bacterium]
MPAKIIRWKIAISGIVQGVGFRPFIYCKAAKHKIAGFVANTAKGVIIEAEGSLKNLESFQTAIQTNSPPLAELNEIITKTIEPQGDTAFSIALSFASTEACTLIPPDITLCKDCLEELFNPEDRRYLYPFINCTNCGPRYTIINNIPYDRPSTAMGDFIMCDDCRQEYDDPKNRRFHAQPNACPACGPQLALCSPDCEEIANRTDAIRQTQQFLKHGKVIAIKGLGGFHLAVDARNDSAVKLLRQRKRREEKPLAIMAKDIETARSICELHPMDEALLISPQSPIVLARKKLDKILSDCIAPGNDLVGVMLPYTPLHHLLFENNLDCLVMTSGNISEEPICIDNDEAFHRLKEIADYFLIHDRDIYLRNDDSVVIHLHDRTRIIRRSRGYVPVPVFIKNAGPTVLGVGTHLKNTVCLLRGKHALMSQHLGDLENLPAYDFFTRTINHMQTIFDCTPEMIIHDLHPDYLSSRWATEQGCRLLAVQHHHAHLAACLAENLHDGPAIGIIMDGTGYSADGTIWGGEVLIGDFKGYKRYAHFEEMPLPGGDIAIKEPWRTAVAYLHQAHDTLPDLPFLAGHDIAAICQMLEKDVNCPKTSSCGRLFDAVATICGGKPIIRYEAQAAIEFMQAGNGIAEKSFDFEFTAHDGILHLPVRSIIRSVTEAVRSGRTMSEISRRFHKTLIDLFTAITIRAAKDSGIKTVALSGGVFQNQILFCGLIPELEKSGFTVLTHSLVPTNDGCISLGQAVIGREYLKSAEG